MHLQYLDNSGSTQNKDENYLVLGGISVFERQIHYISKELDIIARRVNPADPSVIEFHASEIFAARNAPWKGMSKKDR